MDIYATIVAFFQNGGVFMFPIAVVMAIGIAIALERWLYLTRQTVSNRRDYEKLMPLLRAQKVREVQDLASQSKSAVAKLAADGVARRAFSRRRADLESGMEEQLLEVIPHIERRTPYLATYANVATLLGLLGTIMGLISAFTAVQMADSTQKAAMLSESISVSMNCTAFGLMVAIPLLIIHSLLQSKTNAIVESLEITVVKFLNLLEDKASDKPMEKAVSASKPSSGHMPAPAKA
jgi:biopolymer transport protein ExbB/TolQ